MGTVTGQSDSPWDDTPVSPVVQAMAMQAVRDFHECFWWWNENFIPVNRGDVREIITQLRKSGPRKAWECAQRLQKCL